MYGQWPRGGRGISWSRLWGGASLTGASCPRPSPRNRLTQFGAGDPRTPPTQALERGFQLGLLGGACQGKAVLLRSNGGRSVARAAAVRHAMRARP